MSEVPEAKTPMQKQREERRALGWRDVNIWLKPEGLARVARLQQPGESLSDVLDRALAALEAAQNGKAASHGPSELSGDTVPQEALRTFITSEISRYLSSETFREQMVPLVKQLARVLPSDTTSYLTSEEVSTPAIPRRAHIGKAAVLKRLQAMQAEGLSNADMERRLNAEHVPTVTGQGRWHRRTIGKMLAQAEA